MTINHNQEFNWQSLIEREQQQPYFQKIINFLTQQRLIGKTIYPEQNDIFNALKLTSFKSTKVVIIGQDPYHGPNQAIGLSFAVKQGIKLPPSLKNIYKELAQDLNISSQKHGDLTSWAKQGVLLLNATLTVEAHKPQSHAKIGWQQFTDQVIKALNQHPKGIVYLLWGANAQKKENLIDVSKHKILKTTHPSPLSAYRGFLGSQVFSKTNSLLRELNRSTIDWTINPLLHAQNT